MKNIKYPYETFSIIVMPWMNECLDSPFNYSIWVFVFFQFTLFHISIKYIFRFSHWTSCGTSSRERWYIFIWKQQQQWRWWWFWMLHGSRTLCPNNCQGRILTLFILACFGIPQRVFLFFCCLAFSSKRSTTFFLYSSLC